MPQMVAHYVEVYPFRVLRDSVEYLLLLRSPHESLYPGMWQVVTGTCENGETAVQAAKREFAEETGLRPARWWVVPRLNAFYDIARDSVNLSPAFACQLDPEAEPVLSGEHSAWRWLQRKEAARLLVWPGQREGLTVVEEYIVAGQKASELLRLP